jgi:hypothetical protein
VLQLPVGVHAVAAVAPAWLRLVLRWRRRFLGNRGAGNTQGHGAIERKSEESASHEWMILRFIPRVVRS